MNEQFNNSPEGVPDSPFAEGLTSLVGSIGFELDRRSNDGPDTVSEFGSTSENLGVRFCGGSDERGFNFEG